MKIRRVEYCTVADESYLEVDQVIIDDFIDWLVGNHNTKKEYWEKFTPEDFINIFSENGKSKEWLSPTLFGKEDDGDLYLELLDAIKDYVDDYFLYSEFEEVSRSFQEYEYDTIVGDRFNFIDSGY